MTSNTSKIGKAKIESAVQFSTKVEEYVRHGKTALRERDWAEAMIQFNKAITYHGKRNLTLWDWRVRAMIEMPEWHSTAYQVTQMMVQQSPDDYRGYYRQAKVLLKMNAIDAALAAAIKAVKVGPTKSQDETLNRALQRFKADLIISQHEHHQKRAAYSAEEKQKVEAAKMAAKKSKMNFIHLLSPDIIINIAEIGSVDNYGFTHKMAGVCRNWRNILLNTGTLWNTLVLGKKRVMDRVKCCVERTKGNIKEIIVKSEFEIFRLTDIDQILKPYLKNTRRLTIDGDATKFSRHWQGEFHHLNYLKIKSTSYEASDLVYRLLAFDADGLEELDLEGGRYEHIFNSEFDRNLQDPDHRVISPGDPPFWTEHASKHLSSVHTFRIKNCLVAAAYPDHSELICHFPKLETFEMVNVHWESNSALIDTSSKAYIWSQKRRPLEIDLGYLRSYNVSGQIRNLGLGEIHAPNLHHLDLWSAHPLGSPLIAPHLSTPGLADALSKLLSLDVGKCTIDIGDLRDVLITLPSLKFLNVSYCSLDNSFLELLERKGSDKDLLPNLTALSIAGNSEIRSGAIRRFVLSRTPNGLKPTNRPTEPVKGGPFRPSVPVKSAFGPSKPKSQPATSLNQALTAQNLTTSKPVSTVEAKKILPSIQWLCLDNCDSIEPEIVDYLRRKVRFISNLYSTAIVEARVRGKGRYSWMMEFDIGCGSGEKGCQVRRLPGSKDGYYIHHTCQQAGPNDTQVPGWTQLSQSQSQSQGLHGGFLGSMISSGSLKGF
ncbi:uncharacterized protein I206_100215 [Kwoniella pini CBS 10737]|uniref:Uncharacterized protein n=1 Tax=Kwoniella pini CBS 10737 TaxID=1296096 RepID=A0A1B9IE39_9TREE|nr:uncharacterized protein I206_01110 [Kwoniella pini CBS 10737]OCF53803.1 hypothetical protein I206_01110 [Kwoniella pini CBS 10737]